MVFGTAVGPKPLLLNWDTNTTATELEHKYNALQWATNLGRMVLGQIYVSHYYQQHDSVILVINNNSPNTGLNEEYNMLCVVDKVYNIM